ncbi:MAG: DNA-binding protein [Rhodospirillaceae bacterium]|nr:DNA-binding protein [Rhodospirillaceae bacterium]|tara:strand:+ start:12832 stop:13152 length:321 start_codon:yes stop_codon:yes gene_type:complete
MAAERNAHFHIGQVVEHQRFGYRGVIFDVDAEFSNGDEWYEQMAKSRPPKDRPWYHVLVDGAAHTTYVAERHLTASEDARPIAHPLLDQFFTGFHDGQYVLDVVRN